MYPGAAGYGGYGGYSAYPGAAYPGAPPPNANQPAPVQTPTPTGSPGHATLATSSPSATFYTHGGSGVTTSQPNVAGTPSASPLQPHASLMTTASMPVLPSQHLPPVDSSRPKPRKAEVRRRDFKIDENAKDLHGWMIKEPDFVHFDMTDQFRDQFHDVAGQMWRVPEEARLYRYLLIPGLFTNSYPGYMEGVIKHLRQKHFDVIKAPIDTGGSVLHNAEEIAKVIERDDSGKQIVLMGHSKGGVDLTAALCLYPHIQARVRAVVCLQAPHGGTPIPSDILDGGVVSFVTGVVKPFDPAALKDLSYQARIAFWKENDYPSHIPTLNFVTHCKKAFAVMSMTHSHIQTKYLSRNDGLVPLHDGLLPQTASILLGGLDHGAPVFDMQAHKVYKPGPLFECLICCVLSLPRPFDFAKLCTPLQQQIMPPQVGEVFLYPKPDFDGEMVRLRRSEIGELRNYGLEKIQSVKLGPNTVVEFFGKEHCLGNALMTLNANAPKITSLADKLRSVRITTTK